jgi:hypothetical protein
VEGYLEIKD